MLTDLTNQAYLLQQQYADSRNLEARIALHRDFNTNPVSLYSWYFEQLALPPAAHILELGCGPGGFWQHNREQVPGGWRLTLSDFSPGMVARARQNLTGAPFGQCFLQIDAQEIPFKADSFDAVLANYMLYHVPDRPQALAEIRRVLRPNSRLYAATNGENHLVELAQLAADFDPSFGRTLNGETSGFTLENGRRQLAEQFSTVDIHRFPDRLKVTEVEPLLAYMLSSLKEPLSARRKQALRAYLQAEMAAQNGCITIQKDTGLFIAGG